MSRVIAAAFLAFAVVGCTTANEPENAPQTTAHVTRTRIDSWTAILRDDDRGVTCYLWGTTGIYCLRDSPEPSR